MSDADSMLFPQSEKTLKILFCESSFSAASIYLAFMAMFVTLPCRDL